MSNFMTNLISIQMTQRQVIELTNKLTVTQLKDIYKNAQNQYQVYSYKHNKNECVQAMESSAAEDFSNPNSLALAFDRTGKLFFYISASGMQLTSFSDEECLATLNSNFDRGIREGRISFDLSEQAKNNTKGKKAGEYFGVYKYIEGWNVFLVRAEARMDTDKFSRKITLIISLIIILLTCLFVVLGIYMFKKIFQSISSITQSLYDMQQRSKLEVINIDDAPNDDVTYMAASFNTLSVSVNNLLSTFQKFVSKDVVSKAYTDHTIRLEGKQRELTILFSDIKSFTYRTETLGNEIIDLLNVHYNSVIHDVHKMNGVVGSIIGDAILAIFGTYNSGTIKSAEAIDAGWEITYVTAELRRKMKEQRKKIELTRKLTDAEERVYKAVLLDIGVGIDGGTVFYGNIGSDEHMTNTVIGDNVNSASRLEGVTRVYRLPVIVSEYIKKEVAPTSERYKFYEIDTIQVKGKTEGKKIFYPLDTFDDGHEELEEKFEVYEKALAAYYDGDWKSARKFFKLSDLEVSKVFLERMGLKSAPANWSGIWTMTTK
ncbi:MAG: adenylate/guanylate cyclase domain-containing protein [Treponema sp.]|nr:adenylate/guanylate cyclase domain-containing protein [Treponema sp.]